MPFGIGLPEILIFLVVVLLLFGASRVPEIGRSMGKGMREFKDAVSGRRGRAARRHSRARLRTRSRWPRPARARRLPARPCQAPGACRAGSATARRRRLSNISTSADGLIVAARRRGVLPGGVHLPRPPRPLADEACPTARTSSHSGSPSRSRPRSSSASTQPWPRRSGARLAGVGFFAPAVEEGRQKVVARFVAFATILFAGGMAFAYFVILPLALKFLTNFDDDLYDIQIRASYYLSFAALMIFATGRLPAPDLRPGARAAADPDHGSAPAKPKDRIRLAARRRDPAPDGRPRLARFRGRAALAAVRRLDLVVRRDGATMGHARRTRHGMTICAAYPRSAHGPIGTTQD